ncbi:MAG: ComF family protein [Clostridia bacterium]|nr:ComF family protein [Clostridia bacterium]
MLKTVERSIKEKISDVFFPPSLTCCVCGEELFDEYEYYICPECFKLLTLNDSKICLRCGSKIEGEESYCGICGSDEVFYEYIRSAVVYDEFARILLHKFKFGNHREFGKCFAKLMERKFNLTDMEVDAVAYVPMTERSLKERRYNQSEIIACEFCILTGLPLFDGLKKIKDTSDQVGKGAADRMKNLKGVMKAQSGVENLSVLVIDDIKTTGATINECARALKKAGAAKVYGLTYASTVAKVRINK